MQVKHAANSLHWTPITLAGVVCRWQVVFKSTKKKGEETEGKKVARNWCKPPQNLGDMEGTIDAWVLVASFTFSFLTAVVGIFQIIDRPFTAQGDFRWGAGSAAVSAHVQGSGMASTCCCCCISVQRCRADCRVLGMWAAFGANTSISCMCSRASAAGKHDQTR